MSRFPLLSAVALLTTGCCLSQVCDECPLPIWLYVTDASDGTTLGETLVTIDAPTCWSHRWQGDTLKLGCELDLDHELTLSADSYLDATVTVNATSVEAQGCCACDFELAEVEVELEPVAHDEG